MDGSLSDSMETVGAPNDWLDELEPGPGPPFLRMGTRALTGDWLIGGADVPELLAEKQRILDRHHDQAVVVSPTIDTEAAGAELLSYLPPFSGLSPRKRGQVHPIDVAGRLVAEDFCLLMPADEGWILGAGSVCFPSHWRLGDKIGRPVALVHGPVPHYAAELAQRVDHFLDRLRPGPGVWRRNWTIHASPQLFVPDPPPPPDPPISQADAAARLWVRSERQTLRRLPETGSIVFGIRTQQVPLGAVATRPELCRRLAEAAASWDADLLAYRGGEAIRGPLTAWLRDAAIRN